MFFLKNMLSGDFGGHFFLETYILCYWVQQKLMFYRWLNLGASPFLQISYWNLYIIIKKFKLYTRPQQYGTTSEDDNIGRPGRGRWRKGFWEFSGKDVSFFQKLFERCCLQQAFAGRRLAIPVIAKIAVPSYLWSEKFSSSDVVPYCWGLV